LARQNTQEAGYKMFALVPHPGLSQKFVREMKLGQSKNYNKVGQSKDCVKFS